MLPNLPSYAQQIPVQPMNPSVAAQNVAASLGRRQLIASRNEPFGVDKKSAELAEQQVAVSKEGLGLQEAMLKELSQLKEINKKMIIGSVQGTRTSSREASMFEKAQTFAEKQKKGGLASKLSSIAAAGGLKGKLAAGVLRAGSGLKNFGKDVGVGALKTAVGVGGAVGLAKFGPQMLDAMGLKDTLVDEDPNAAAKGMLSSSVGSSATGDKERGIFETLNNIDKNLRQNFLLQNPFEKLQTILTQGSNTVSDGFDSVKNKLVEVGTPIAKTLRDKVISGAESIGNLYDEVGQKGGVLLRDVRENVLKQLGAGDKARQLAMSGKKTEGRDIRQRSQNGAISGSSRLTRVLSKAERDKKLQDDEDRSRNRLAELERSIEEGKDVDYTEFGRVKNEFQHIQKVRKEVEGKEGPMPEFREGGFEYTAGKGTFHTATYGGGDRSLTKVGMEEKFNPFTGDYERAELDPNTGLPGKFAGDLFPTLREDDQKADKTTGEKLKSFFSNLFKGKDNKEETFEHNKKILMSNIMETIKGNGLVLTLLRNLSTEEQEKYKAAVTRYVIREARNPKKLKPVESVNDGKAIENDLIGMINTAKGVKSGETAVYKKGKLVGINNTESTPIDSTSESEQSGRRLMMSETAQELEDLAKFAEQEGIIPESGGSGKISPEQMTKFYAQRDKRNTLLNDTMENQALKENQQGQTNAPVVLNNTSKTDTTSFTPNATDPRPKNNSFERKINAVADF